MKRLLRIVPMVMAYIGPALATDLTYISLDFCDSSQSMLTYHLQGGEQTGICYRIKNSSSMPVKIKVGFVDGTFTNDQQQNKACMGDMDVESFGRYVTGYAHEVALAAGETKVQEAKLMYPIGREGLYHGCIVYSVIGDHDVPQNASGFTIIMRSARFIDVLLGNPKNDLHGAGIILAEFTDSDGENLSKDQKIRVYKDDSDGRYIMEIKLKNTSEVDQDVTITGKIANSLSYEDHFVESRKILPGEMIIINKKLGDVPPYDLKIQLELNSMPYSFDTQPAPGGGEPIAESSTPGEHMLIEKTSIGTRKVIGGLAILGLIGIAMIGSFTHHHVKRYRKRKAAHHLHKHYVHEQHPAHHEHGTHHGSHKHGTKR